MANQLTDKDIKCLRKCLNQLLQIVEKLEAGADDSSAPKSKPETERQAINRYKNLIQQKESKRLKK